MTSLSHRFASASASLVRVPNRKVLFLPPAMSAEWEELGRRKLINRRNLVWAGVGSLAPITICYIGAACVLDGGSGKYFGIFDLLVPLFFALAPLLALIQIVSPFILIVLYIERACLKARRRKIRKANVRPKL